MGSEGICLVQKHQEGEENEARNSDAEQVANLHARGSSAKDMADLQVLKHFTSDSR